MTDHDTTDTADTDTTGHDDYPNVHAWSWYDREPAHVYDTDQHDTDTDTDTTDRPGHIWQYGRFTGTRTCSRCHLLPVHHDDHLAPCIPDTDTDTDTDTANREDTTR